MKLQERIALRNARHHRRPQTCCSTWPTAGYAGAQQGALRDGPSGRDQGGHGLRPAGGGAGRRSPPASSWGFLVRSPGPPKYILCNCEEGDPGAYNDKGILESDPYTLLEGNDHRWVRDGLLQRLRLHKTRPRRANRPDGAGHRAGVRGRVTRGKNILGSDFSFDIEVSLTGESYVAGEETALMESIEGSRSMPRSRPPFPAAAGVWGKPSNHQQRQEPVVRAGDNLPRERSGSPRLASTAARGPRSYA